MKKCKGSGKALGHGCGKELMFTVKPNGIKTYNAKYGLCMEKCYKEWLVNTEEGQEVFLKSLATGRKKVRVKQKKENKKKKESMKIDLMSIDKYRSQYVQPVINAIARKIDFGCPCIATENFGKMNAGHYISVGANRTIALNLHNLHNQAFESNHFKSGDTLKYQQGIIKIYGQEYLDYMESLKSCPPLNLTKLDLKEIKENASQILKSLDDVFKPPNERIRLRNEINKQLGIYDLKYCEYAST